MSPKQSQVHFQGPFHEKENISVVFSVVPNTLAEEAAAIFMKGGQK